jgi:glycosyltransferase involved in cell wall biosynthesis
MAENVLHILGSAQPEGTGIARMVGALAKYMDRTRYTVHAWFLARDGPLVAELEAAGARVRCIDWPAGAGDPGGAWRFWQSCRSHTFAIIHQHFGGRAPRWIARWSSQAKVVAHLWGHLSESRGLGPLPLRSQGADLVIATSQAVGDCVVGARARVVYPGVDIPNGRIFARRLSSPSSEVVVGTAGRLVPLKGNVYLIRALGSLCREFPNLRLEIAGSGPERPALEQEVHSQHLEDRIRFLGWQPNLLPLMMGWDIYAQPSLGEPFGIAALEAMSVGLPVVATAAGGLPELVEHGRTGWLVPPSNPQALAKRLRGLMVDPEQRRHMGAAGRARARESFSMARMVGVISSIYDEVLAAG